MHKKITLLFILCLVGVFLLTSGCTQSSTSGSSVQYRDDELIAAITDSPNTLTPMMESIGDNAEKQEWAEMGIESKNLESEARAQYEKIDKITPVSPDLLTAKQKCLSGLEYLEKSGRIGAELSDAVLIGDMSKVQILGDEFGDAANQAADYFYQTSDALSGQNRLSTQQVTAVKTQKSTGVQITENPDKTTLGEKNAAKKALEYLRVMSFSRQGLIEQLEYEGFTHEQAVYGVDQSGADWNQQAALKAKEYLRVMSFSRQGLIEQLEYEGFTHEQAVYGVQAVGY